MRAIESLEFLKRSLDLIVWYSRPGVAHLDTSDAAAPAALHRYFPMACIADCVGDEVSQDTFQQNRIGMQRASARLDVEFQPFSGGRSGKCASQTCEHLLQREVPRGRLNHAGIQLRYIE